MGICHIFLLAWTIPGTISSTNRQQPGPLYVNRGGRVCETDFILDPKMCHWQPTVSRCRYKTPISWQPQSYLLRAWFLNTPPNLCGVTAKPMTQGVNRSQCLLLAFQWPRRISPSTSRSTADICSQTLNARSYSSVAVLYRPKVAFSRARSSNSNMLASSPRPEALLRGRSDHQKLFEIVLTQCSDQELQRLGSRSPVTWLTT